MVNIKNLEAAVMVTSVIGKKITITMIWRENKGDWRREICEEQNMHKIN